MPRLTLLLKIFVFFLNDGNGFENMIFNVGLNFFYFREQVNPNSVSLKMDILIGIIPVKGNVVPVEKFDNFLTGKDEQRPYNVVIFFAVYGTQTLASASSQQFDKKSFCKI